MNGMLIVGIILWIFFILLWWFNRPKSDEKENTHHLKDVVPEADPTDMSEEDLEKLKEAVLDDLIKSQEDEEDLDIESKVDTTIRAENNEIASVNIADRYGKDLAKIEKLVTQHTENKKDVSEEKPKPISTDQKLQASSKDHFPKNGLCYELASQNMDNKFQALSRDVVKIGAPLLKPLLDDWKDNSHILSLRMSKFINTEFEFKLFGMAYFLNKLKHDNDDIFRKFLKVCFSHFSKEIKQMYIEESMSPFIMPTGFSRDDNFLAEKIGNYMDDINNYERNKSHPRFSQLSLIEWPNHDIERIRLQIRSFKLNPEFLQSYVDFLEKLEYRYKNTPSVKSR